MSRLHDARLLRWQRNETTWTAAGTRRELYVGRERSSSNWAAKNVVVSRVGPMLGCCIPPLKRLPDSNIGCYATNSVPRSHSNLATQLCAARHASAGKLAVVAPHPSLKTQPGTPPNGPLAAAGSFRQNEGPCDLFSLPFHLPLLATLFAFLTLEPDLPVRHTFTRSSNDRL